MTLYTIDVIMMYRGHPCMGGQLHSVMWSDELFEVCEIFFSEMSSIPFIFFSIKFQGKFPFLTCSLIHLWGSRIWKWSIYEYHHFCQTHRSSLYLCINISIFDIGKVYIWNKYNKRKSTRDQFWNIANYLQVKVCKSQFSWSPGF